MRLTNTIFVLSFVSTAFGFILPTGLSDGIYEGSLDATGEPTLNKIGNLTLPQNRRDLSSPFVAGGSSRPSLARRDQVGCTGRNVEEWRNYDLYRAMENACSNNGNFLKARSFHTIYNGGTYWYVCNYRREQTGCNFADVYVARNSIVYRCGSDRTGWDYISAPDQTFGVDVASAEVCGNL
ncbi:hypothetical protein OQA88_9541 [Cercophora sp. LCS_1]